MPLSYKQTSQPYCEPVTLAQAKAQCVVDAAFVDDDALIAALIAGARQYLEKRMNRAIFSRGMQLFLDHFPYPIYDGTVNPNDRHCLYGYFWHALAIRLPMPLCQDVESIQYIDLSGEITAFDPSLWFVDVNSQPARIVPQPGVYWPYTQSWLPNSVTIAYTAGSYDNEVEDSLTVSAGAISLSQAAAMAAGTILQTSAITLVDASGNPVVFTVPNPQQPGSLAVNPSYNGQILTATYYCGMAPQTVCQAMLLLISYWYNHRDAAETNPPKALDFAVEALISGESFDTFNF